jgi:hypothetical protein
LFNFNTYLLTQALPLSWVAKQVVVADCAKYSLKTPFRNNLVAELDKHLFQILLIGASTTEVQNCVHFGGCVVSAIDAGSCFGLALSNAFDTVRLFERSSEHNWRTVLKLPKSNLEGKTAAEAMGLINASIDQLPFDLDTTMNWMLSIPAIGKNGFSIDISRSGPDHIVGLFGGLEETFETLREALSWVECALSNAYCLQIKSYGSQVREWRLAPVDPHSTGGVLAVGNLNMFGVLRDHSVSIKQNACTA